MDALSIEDLCAAVGATVGAFYSRFESKDAYFNALQEVAAARGRARFRALAASAELDGDLEAACQAIATAVVEWFGENEGVLRASLQHDSTHPDRWGLFKQLGRDLTKASAKRMLPALGSGRRDAKLRAIGFAYQVLFGTLINAVLNDPGPCRLRDLDLAARMARLFSTIVQQERPRAPRRRAPKRS